MPRGGMRVLDDMSTLSGLPEKLPMQHNTSDTCA